jgi:predicted transcriptional regulator
MRRTRQEILSEILEICKKGASKTQIVYRVNLNFKMVNLYLDILIKKDLIRSCQDNGKLYKTTPEGANLLDTINQINDVLLDDRVKVDRKRRRLNVIRV